MFLVKTQFIRRMLIITIALLLDLFRQQFRTSIERTKTVLSMRNSDCKPLLTRSKLLLEQTFYFLNFSERYNVQVSLLYFILEYCSSIIFDCYNYILVLCKVFY